MSGVVTQELYRIVDEPTGDTYRQLVDYVGEKAATLSLVLVGSGKKSQEARRTLESLRPFLINIVETREWPGTVLEDEYTGLLHRFYVRPESLRILIKVADRLYAWSAPSLPDDLCFYRADAAAVLTSTAHEREGDVRLSSDEYNELCNRIPGLVLERVLRH